jgi:hypothetical protein
MHSSPVGTRETVLVDGQPQTFDFTGSVSVSV